MAVPRKLPAVHADVFPAGAFLKGGVEPVIDFEASKGLPADAPKVQQTVVTEHGEQLLVWQVTVIDADEVASKRDSAITVKFTDRVQPVPPANNSGFPFTPVEFTGLTITPYVDQSNANRPRVAFSLRAEGMTTPSATGATSRASRRTATEGEVAA